MLIAGNWKMHKDLEASVELATGVADGVDPDSPVDVAVCPPFVNIRAVTEAVADTPVAVGAQTVHHEKSGAYTGSVSAPMLRAVGCTYTIVGHSERRQYQGETDADVNRQMAAALEHDLIPIVCVGESLEERKAGRAEAVVEEQVTGALEGLGVADPEDIVVAYEPIWAIGTGETATPEQAQTMHAHVRSLLEGLLPAGTEPTTEIVYGGSMKPYNAAELLGQPDITGGLVGGASLQAEDFTAIVEEAEQVVA